MSDTTPTLPAWMEALDQIEAILARRLQQLPEPPTPPAPGPRGVDAEMLRRVDERIARWHEGVEKAERQARDAGADVDATLGALAAWKDHIASVRVRLEAWLRRAA